MHNPKFPLEPAWRMLVDDMQLDFQPALARARLPADLLVRQDAELSLPEYLRLWRALESVMVNPAFPVEMVPRLRSEGFDPALFAAFCSPDLNTALVRLSRFKALKGPISLRVDRTDKATTLEVNMHGVAASELPSSLVGAELVFFVHLARSGTGRPVRPLRAESPLRLSGAKAYQAYLGVPVVLGATTRVVFDAADAALPFLSRNEAMWAHFEPTLQQRLDQLQSKAALAERVRACLLERLPAGGASVAQVAARLLMSQRTLQRRLSDEDQSFQGILRQVRMELAAHYLDNMALSVAQIAYLLGFEDPSSFSRAYREWTGLSPDQARVAAA